MRSDRRDAEDDSEPQIAFFAMTLYGLLASLSVSVSPMPAKAGTFESINYPAIVRKGNICDTLDLNFVDIKYPGISGNVIKYLEPDYISGEHFNNDDWVLIDTGMGRFYAHVGDVRLLARFGCEMSIASYSAGQVCPRRRTPSPRP
ncbi:hypothetical protein ABIE45_006395 [Methylobacterium sp. OAE515]|uniref:hypothetical protein n=1 Tax=Methylobacterium sp. OAE515 TaxID=2817895 RepID=UPI00178B3AB0